MDDRLTPYARRIQDRCADLDVATIRLIEQGQHHDIVVVNEDLIFRFPRYTAGIGRLQREVEILRALQDRLPLPIPRPVYTSFTPRVAGQVFMGYRMLRGAPLQHQTLTAMDETQLHALGMQIGRFLASLHSMPLGDVLPGEGDPVRPVHRWDDLYARIQHRLFPYMRPEVRVWTTKQFETFLRDPGNRDIAPTLVHGDFGASNILYDVEGQCISGVIDFSSAGPDDPAVDLAAVATIAPSILKHVSSGYPGVEGALGRVAFYKGTFALQEALFGIENGDEAAFRAGIEEYI